jgi:membrane fusion protein (multidrug efflux system)
MKKIIFIIGIICFASFLWTSCSKNQTATSEKKSATDNYLVYTVKEQTLETTLRLPAQLNPYEEVSIYPRITGYVKNIPVDIGTEVKKGQILMELEAPDIEQNNVAAHERYIKSQSVYNTSRDEYFRLLKTAETKGAVSANDLQSSQSKMKSDSAMSNSEKANWQAMEAIKDYLVVKAPFDGTITQRNIHPGALVTVGNKSDTKPVLELQEIAKLRLQVNVPETFATQMKTGQKISFISDAMPGKTFSGSISRKANSLDQKFRSELVEIDVANSDNTLMAGMYAEVLLPLNGHTNASIVPQSALVTSTEKKYVIKVVDHKAVLTNVITGNENNGMIEVFGDIKVGDFIVSKASEDIKQDQLVN